MAGISIKAKADLADVYEQINKMSQTVKEECELTGKNAVDYAKQNHTYKNRTGTLERSNRYEADDTGLTLINDAISPQGHYYASNVEARGYDVLSAAALKAQNELQSKTRR